ncbi:MAG: hypothetical protein ABEI80_02345 [Haloplanus sp.]
MRSISYWINTFLSRPDELGALILTLSVFGIAARVYSDQRDRLAVVVGVLLLFGGLGVAGPDVGLEWHYWLGGGTLVAAAILLIDSRG